MDDVSRSLPGLGLGSVDGLSAAFRGTLEGLCTPVALDAGATLFHQGDAADAMFLLESGRMEVSTLSDEGRKLALNVLTAGTVFGEIALFDEGLRSATVTAMDRCHLLRADRRGLLQEIRDNPDFALEMIRLCLQRLRWVNTQLEDQVFQPLDVRLARRVIYLLDTMGDGAVLAISQSEIADHVGVTREAVAKTLSEWKKAGIVQIGRGRITVVDQAALHERAEAGAI